MFIITLKPRSVNVDIFLVIFSYPSDRGPTTGPCVTPSIEARELQFFVEV